MAHRTLSIGWIRVLFVILLFVSVGAAVDPTGTISGVVTDPSGAVIPGATVTVKHASTGLTRSTVTDAQGAFLFPLMPVGGYGLTVEASGFRRFEQSGITLVLNSVANLPVIMQLGSLNESINVQADAAMVETRSGTLQGVVDQQRIVDLPLNGRNAANLVLLVAGTVDLMAGNSRGSGDAIQGGTYPGGQAVSTSGARSDGVNYLLDGGSNRDPYTNVNDPFPNPDALQEFVVQTNNYSAEQGRASGAVVSVVTKSGTNQIHGSAFEFLRNNALNARNFFSPAADVLKRNQFGGSIGGPVVKDKLFYFATAQGMTHRAQPGSLNAVVPTAAMRSGDFSAISRELKDPATGQPFSGNQIPTSMFVAPTVKMLEDIPVPDNPQGVIYYSRPIKRNEYQVMGRMDYNTSKNRLYGRYSISDYTEAPVTVTGNILAAAQGRDWRNQNVGASDTYTFGPNLINSLTFAYGRTNTTVVSGAPYSLPDLGVKIAQTTPPEITLSVSGYFSIGTGHPGLFARQSYNISDNVHYIRGMHELSMGFDYLKMNIDLINTYRQNGNFRFRGTSYSGNAMSDFFLGKVERFIQGGGEYAARRGTLVSAFFQDNIRMGRRLTVNLGVRYDPFVPYGDELGRTDCFRPGKKSTRFPNAPTNYIYAGDDGCPAGGSQSHYALFAPRFGFSYDLTGEGKTVVRGGYGIFYQPPFVEAFNNMVDSAPFSPQFYLFGTRFVDPFGDAGMRNPFPEEFGPRQPPSDVQFEIPMAAVSYSNEWTPGQIQSWNLTLEHQLLPDLMVRGAYVGSNGTHLGYNTDLNAPRYNSARPYQDFQTAIEDQAAGNSIYNSFQATVEKRFARSFSLLASYTWAKSLDTASYLTDLDGINIINPFNVRAYRGPSDFNTPHRLVVSYLWRGPELKGQSALARKVAGGWELSGIWNWQSGFPLTFTSGEDRSLSEVGNDNADLVGNPYLDPNRPRGELIQRYFNSDAFALAARGTFGNAGRNILYGPGTFLMDFSAMKNFRITEGARIQFRAEFFNLFNTPLFNNPSTSVTDSRFGQITGARDPRIIQLALKVYF